MTSDRCLTLHATRHKASADSTETRVLPKHMVLQKTVFRQEILNSTEKLVFRKTCFGRRCCILLKCLFSEKTFPGSFPVAIEFSDEDLQSWRTITSFEGASQSNVQVCVSVTGRSNVPATDSQSWRARSIKRYRGRILFRSANGGRARTQAPHDIAH